MNAVNKNMVDFMQIAADYVLENGRGIVIGNQAPGFPGAFSAGGDLGFMLGLAKAKKFTEIDDFIKARSRRHHGNEIRPHSDRRGSLRHDAGRRMRSSASRPTRSSHTLNCIMGLVEIGAGLVPGGCGMMHLWQRYMDTVPGNVKLADYAAYFIPAFMCVAQAKVSMSAAEARKNGFLRPTDRIVFNKDNLIGEAKKECLKMVDDGYAPPAKKKYPVMGQEAQGMIWAEMLNMRAGGYIPKHMEFIAKKAAYCMTGGEARSGSARF